LPSELPLVAGRTPDRPVAWRSGRVIHATELLAAAAAVAPGLPAGQPVINLCEQRYGFLVALCAALLRGCTSLLPPSRAERVIAELAAAYPGSLRCDDATIGGILARQPEFERPAGVHVPMLESGQLAVRTFTSGSTGQPTSHAKSWGSLSGTTARSAERIRASIPDAYGNARPWIVATVPPQHTFGMEMSVLLPLLGDMGIHSGRPLFPADVAAALAEVSVPRVLVSTPLHLRALVESGQDFPDVALVVSATASLDASLAARVEDRLRATVVDLLGSTETCAIATRESAREDAWRPYQGVVLTPQLAGTAVAAPWFDQPTVLQDIVEFLPDGRFVLRGRHTDLIEIAGKRASLAELTRRVLAVPGVLDAFVFQPDRPAHQAVGRVAALAVAPGLTAPAIIEQLRESIDAAFLPRPLLIVAALPRNESGKLPQADLVAALLAGRDNPAPRQ
jgi:acyl-coenzyme A synthetase/AMP-(fatty) acid ligase